MEAVGGCGGHCQYSSRHLPHTVLGVLEFPPHLPHQDDQSRSNSLEHFVPISMSRHAAQDGSALLDLDVDDEYEAEDNDDQGDEEHEIDAGEPRPKRNIKKVDYALLHRKGKEKE